MPDKQQQIEELKQSINNLHNYFNQMQEMESTTIMLGIIAAKIYELEEKLEKLEAQNE